MSQSAFPLLPILFRAAPRIHPEQPPEIGWIIVSHTSGDFGNVELRVQNQRPGTFQPKTIHIADGRNAVCVAEDTADMGVTVSQLFEGSLHGARRIISLAG